MMLAWSFSARTADEVARLVRLLGKHRYVREVDLRVHWAIDAALAASPLFAPHADAFEQRRRREPGLDPSSRDPSLWRASTADEIAAVLGAFWTPGAEADRLRDRLLALIASTGLPAAAHAPFGCSPEDPPHPELVLLDWVLLPVEDLDAERHAGALTAMEEAGEEVHPSDPIFQEGPILSAQELCFGAPNGVLADDFVVWSDGPYSYASYVFRGASKAAKLLDPPVGYHDI